jgi:ATP-dependent Clp protease ATP-binding subunit ClpX
MARRSSQGTEALRCSFCRKSQDLVLKLIGSPVEGPIKPYICDECVAVCASILEDDREPSDAHLRADHPLTPQLMVAIERWIGQEMSGADAVQELAGVRALAIAIMRLEPRDSPPK